MFFYISPNSINSAQNLRQIAKLVANHSKKSGMAGLRWGLRSCSTLHHPSWDPYGGHGMVQQPYMRCCGSEQTCFSSDWIWDWQGVSKHLTWSSWKSDFAWHSWTSKIWFHNRAWLISQIWKTWDGSAATGEALWFRTDLFWLWLWFGWVFQNFWFDPAQNQKLFGLAQMDSS
jgi:hypothetical protein